MTAPEPDPLRSCRGKARYSSEALADSVRRRVYHERAVRLRAYACVACGGWHLTKQVRELEPRPGWTEERAPRSVPEQPRRKRRR